MGDWLGWFGATSSLGLGCEVCVGFAGLFDLVTGSCLGPTVTIGADFAVLSFFMVVVTSFRVGLSVTEPGVVLEEGAVAALTTRPPRTTWFRSVSRLSCSADGSARFVFEALGVLGAPPLYCVQQAPASEAPP